MKEFNYNFKFPITALREISILQSLDHPNILKIKNIVIA
jgi:serine/threonine protein kinase